MKYKIIIMFILLIALGCGDESNFIREFGTIKYMSFEGGFYGIISDSGNKYLPEKLDSEFQKDGQRVYFEGEVFDRPTVIQWGRILKIYNIRKIN